MDSGQSLEAQLRQRLHRHGWRLESRPAATGDGSTAYRIVDESDGSPIIGDEFVLDLQDVAVWLE